MIKKDVQKSVIINILLIIIGNLEVISCLPLTSYTIHTKLPTTITAYTQNPQILQLEDLLPSTNQITDYFQARQLFLNNEQNRSLGSNLELNDKELQVNEIIKKLKIHELNEGFKKPYDFTPSRHFFEVYEQINNSKLFQLIQLMPKGGVLHAHDTALNNVDYIINGILNNAKYHDILWYSYNKIENLVKFQFSKSKPINVMNANQTQTPNNFSDWTLLADARKQSDDPENFDKFLRQFFTLYTKEPTKDFQDINDVWRKFLQIFMTLDPIVTYAPVWTEYFYEALRQFRLDNVQYLEFRGLLPVLHDLEGTKYTQMDTVRIYKETLDRFLKDFPDFIGAKFIYGPNRKVDNSTFDDYMTTVKDIKKAYPDFVAGFDLVAQEDSGNPLQSYIPQLLELKNTNPEIQYYFHAGETNWNGMSTDENLIDAVLLGTKRIGHGYAILKHPNVMEIIKKHNIAIEINPISNQVLKLVNDNRNHPAAHLLSNNYPIVVSSDDPGFWEAKPLSHDFYIAFVGIASGHSDLKLLKKLAQNSIEFSSLDAVEQQDASKKWLIKWNEFIDYVILNQNQFTISDDK